MMETPSSSSLKADLSTPSQLSAAADFLGKTLQQFGHNTPAARKRAQTFFGLSAQRGGKPPPPPPGLIAAYLAGQNGNNGSAPASAAAHALQTPVTPSLSDLSNPSVSSPAAPSLSSHPSPSENIADFTTPAPSRLQEESPPAPLSSSLSASSVFNRSESFLVAVKKAAVAKHHKEHEQLQFTKQHEHEEQEQQHVPSSPSPASPSPSSSSLHISTSPEPLSPSSGEKMLASAAMDLREVPESPMSAQDYQQLLLEREEALVQAAEIGSQLIEKNSILEARNAAMEREIVALKDTISRELQPLRQKMSELKTENSALLSKAASLRSERNQLSTQVATLREDLQKSKEEGQGLSVERLTNERLRRQVQELLEEVEKYRSEVVSSRGNSTIIGSSNSISAAAAAAAAASPSAVIESSSSSSDSDSEEEQSSFSSFSNQHNHQQTYYHLPQQQQQQQVEIDTIFRTQSGRIGFLPSSAAVEQAKQIAQEQQHRRSGNYLSSLMLTANHGSIANNNNNNDSNNNSAGLGSAFASPVSSSGSLLSSSASSPPPFTVSLEDRQLLTEEEIQSMDMDGAIAKLIVARKEVIRLSQLEQELESCLEDARARYELLETECHGPLREQVDKLSVQIKNTETERVTASEELQQLETVLTSKLEEMKNLESTVDNLREQNVLLVKKYEEESLLSQRKMLRSAAGTTPVKSQSSSSSPAPLLVAVDDNSSEKTAQVIRSKIYQELHDAVETNLSLRLRRLYTVDLPQKLSLLEGIHRQLQLSELRYLNPKLPASIANTPLSPVTPSPIASSQTPRSNTRSQAPKTRELLEESNRVITDALEQLVSVLQSDLQRWVWSPSEQQKGKQRDPTTLAFKLAFMQSNVPSFSTLVSLPSSAPSSPMASSSSSSSSSKPSEEAVLQGQEEQESSVLLSDAAHSAATANNSNINGPVEEEAQDEMDQLFRFLFSLVSECAMLRKTVNDMMEGYMQHAESKERSFLKSVADALVNRFGK